MAVHISLKSCFFFPSNSEARINSGTLFAGDFPSRAFQCQIYINLVVFGGSAKRDLEKEIRLKKIITLHSKHSRVFAGISNQNESRELTQYICF